MDGFVGLFRDWKKVWFYIGEDAENREAFARFCHHQGYGFNNGWELSGKSIGNAMSLDGEGQLLFLSLMAWSISFRADANQIFENTDVNTVLRGNFKAFITGNPDWVYAGERELVSLEAYKERLQSRKSATHPQ